MVLTLILGMNLKSMVRATDNLLILTATMLSSQERIGTTSI